MKYQWIILALLCFGVLAHAEVIVDHIDNPTVDPNSSEIDQIKANQGILMQKMEIISQKMDGLATSAEIAKALQDVLKFLVIYIRDRTDYVVIATSIVSFCIGSFLTALYFYFKSERKV